MKYDPKLHKRRSIRLKDYDYSLDGWYYLTICINLKECLLGCIQNETMKLNSAGLMIKSWWLKLEKKFSHVELGDYVIMPNHLHGIIQLFDNNDGYLIDDEHKENCRGRPTCLPSSGDNNLLQKYNKPIKGEHVGSPLREGQSSDSNIEFVTLSKVLQWFKTMTTNEYIRGVKAGIYEPFKGKLWQRNYYEHIIRNYLEHQNIAQYIYDNPMKWGKDEYYID